MRGLLVLALVLLVITLVWPLLTSARQRRPPHRPAPSRDELVKDPMCQTYVVRSRSVRRTFGSVEMCFCSDDCAERYVRGGRPV